jgi:hypothetical protein
MASVSSEPQGIPTNPPADEPEPFFGDRIALYLLVGGFFVLAGLILVDSLTRLMR